LNLKVYVFLGVVIVQLVIACSNPKVQVANLNPQWCNRYSIAGCGLRIARLCWVQVSAFTFRNPNPAFRILFFTLHPSPFILRLSPPPRAYCESSYHNHKLLSNELLY